MLNSRLLALLLLSVLASISVAPAQNPADVSTYPEKIEITSWTKETVGAPGKESHYILVGTIGDVRYTLRGGPGVDLGTFKAKITNGMYLDILTEEPSGRRYNTGFEITSKERLPSGCAEN